MPAPSLDVPRASGPSRPAWKAPGTVVECRIPLLVAHPPAMRAPWRPGCPVGSRPFIRELMSDPTYTANIRIERIKGPYRHAYLPAHDGPVEFGVHSAIAEHYGVEPEREITTTLDYVMAATGG